MDDGTRLHAADATDESGWIIHASVGSIGSTTTAAAAAAGPPTATGATAIATSNAAAASRTSQWVSKFVAESIPAAAVAATRGTATSGAAW